MTKLPKFIFNRNMYWRIAYCKHIKIRTNDDLFRPPDLFSYDTSYTLPHERIEYRPYMTDQQEGYIVERFRHGAWEYVFSTTNIDSIQDWAQGNFKRENFIDEDAVENSTKEMLYDGIE